MWVGQQARIAAAAIDREAVVRRHTVRFASHSLNVSSTQFTALTVGNGELGCTAEATGLQSLNTRSASAHQFDDSRCVVWHLVVLCCSCDLLLAIPSCMA
jgi:hypothetical protein